MICESIRFETSWANLHIETHTNELADILSIGVDEVRISKHQQLLYSISQEIEDLRPIKFGVDYLFVNI